MALFKRSTLLSDVALEAACQHGKIIEADPRGPKVIRLDSGDFLKIFRARHRFSGTRLYSHARRFYRNALRLQSRGILTVQMLALHHLPTAGQTAVIYKPLAGQSLRDIMLSDAAGLYQQAATFGQFLAEMHDKGIHFHSLHSGNVLIGPDARFGLIDISDMSLYPWPLWQRTRVRSFIRLAKYRAEMQVLPADFWQRVMQGYASYSERAAACVPYLCAHVDYLSNLVK